MPNTNGHGPKRTILYARVSTDEQARTGYSLAQQIEALRAYAAREGYEVLKEVVDSGQSGASLEKSGEDDLASEPRRRNERHGPPGQGGRPLAPGPEVVCRLDDRDVHPGGPPGLRVPVLRARLGAEDLEGVAPPRSQQLSDVCRLRLHGTQPWHV